MEATITRSENTIWRHGEERPAAGLSLLPTVHLISFPNPNPVDAAAAVVGIVLGCSRSSGRGNGGVPYRIYDGALYRRTWEKLLDSGVDAELVADWLFSFLWSDASFDADFAAEEVGDAAAAAAGMVAIAG